MNKIEIDEVLENLHKMIDSKVIVKFKNGRTISGFLTKTGNVFTVKLGVQHIVVEPANLAKVVSQF